MIISKTPLRMSLVGGGSDLPAYYRTAPGAVVSTTIDKYVYVSINPKFDGGIRLAYSRTEEVASLTEIKHDLFRAALEMLDVNGGVEVTTTADIPSRGTGLGSSSSFTVGLLNAVNAFKNRTSSAEWLAATASEIEIERCGAPIGKQDQYAAAYGGMNLIEFNPDGSVTVQPLAIRPETIRDLFSRLIVFYTGITRSASDILARQSGHVEDDARVRARLGRMVELAYILRDELCEGRLDGLGEILRENWSLKKGLASGISNDDVDGWHDAAIAAGADGGKLLGAGSGGFLAFFAPPGRHDAIEAAVGLRRVTFGFEPAGSHILLYSPTPARSGR